jgi:hypothetical protein
MTRKSAAITAGIVVLAALIGIPFLTHHLGYQSGYRTGYHAGSKKEKELLLRAQTAQANAAARKKKKCLYVRDIVAPGDTFSALTHDLYGDGTPKVYRAATHVVKGLSDPSNPDVIKIGQILAFPVVLTVGGEKLYASFPDAVRRWDARQAAESDPPALLPVGPLSGPRVRAYFPDAHAPIIDALDIPSATLSAFPYALPVSLARPSVPQTRKVRRHKGRIIVHIFGRIGILAANGLFMTARTGNPYAGFGAVIGGSVVQFFIRRHEQKLERSLRK